jgi:hypothetical protein
MIVSTLRLRVMERHDADSRCGAEWSEVRQVVGEDGAT